MLTTFTNFYYYQIQTFYNNISIHLQEFKINFYQKQYNKNVKNNATEIEMSANNHK